MSSIDVMHGRLQEWSSGGSAGLFEHFKNVALTNPDAIAIVDGHLRLTYLELVTRVESFGDALHAVGVKAHDQAAVILGNNAGFVIAVLAAWRMGVVVIPMNPALQEGELLKYFLDGRPGILITSIKNKDMGPSLNGKGASLGHLWFYDSAGYQWIHQSLSEKHGDHATLTAPRFQPTADWPALTQYSTGSTGAPKRVKRTHGQLAGEFLSVSGVFGLTAVDRVLGVIPFFHSHGLKNAAMLPLFNGATLYALDTFFPRDVARLIVRERITLYPGVPFMFKQLAALKERNDFSSLRWVFSGAAHLPPETVRAFEGAYSIKLRQVYGTTETGLICVQREPTQLDGFNRVGTPIPGVLVQIVDSHDKPVPEGIDGRIKVTSPFAASKYDNSDGSPESYFAAGSYFPGDIGRISATGQVILSGRHRGFINVGGNKVDPAEVEAALLEVPGVLEAVVLGVHDADSGERVKAVLVASGEVSSSSLRDHLLLRLAEFKHPRTIEFRKELPKSPLGKVQRKDLMEQSSEDFP